MQWTELDLQRLCHDGATETLQLEFKGCGALSKNPEAKTEISKDVSAIANAAGGTIIYGLIEKKRVAHSLDEGFDPQVFSREWLEQIIGSNIQPKVEGLQIDVVPLASKDGRVAYVVTVPQAVSRAPHQAADKRYYKRANFVNQMMEDYEVRDALRRMTVAKLEIEKPKPLLSASSGNMHHWLLCFSLRNASNMTAKFPHVEIEHLEGGTVCEDGVDGNGTFPMQRGAPTNRRFTGGADTVIHPGQSIEVFRLVFHIRVPSGEVNNSSQHARWPDGFKDFSACPLTMTLAISCENAPLSRQKIEYSGAELRKFFGA